MKEPSGPGVRHDCGIYSGYEVPVYYDPILSKLIVWAQTREQAIQRMAATLRDFPILGIKTNIEFLREVITHLEFREGRTFTDFIPQNLPEWVPQRSEELLSQAAIAAEIMTQKTKHGVYGGKTQLPSPWETIGDWHIGSGKG